MSILLGLVQAPALRDPEENLKTLERFAAQAAEKGCTAVCFPECSLTGYYPEEAGALALEQENPLLVSVSRTAAQLSIDILAGFMERRGEDFYITHMLFRRDGSREAYRKTHPGSRERQFFLPGDRLKVLTLSCGVKIGFQLCVETHYPEITQTLALRGAQIVFAPHAVPRVSGDRKAIWDKYICARSYDNRLFMACCNLWDPDRYGGGCLITTPRGETLAQSYTDRPELLVCALDPAQCDAFRSSGSARSRHFYPGLRRRELYD